jgi:predicted dehydrogenase
VGSRSLDRAQRFARGLGIPRAFGDLEEAVRDQGVDAVYVATPPSLHRDHALLCLGAGRPALVEKPFTVTAAEAREVAAAARERSVFCMEAMWTRFLPLVRRLKGFVDSGAIGELRLLTASFGLAERVDGSSSLFDPRLGGGALLDRGVYGLSLAVHLAGPAAGVHGEAAIGTTGVDEDVAVTVRHRAGGLSLVHASLRTQCPNELVVMGTRAHVRVHAPVYRPFRMTLTPVAERGPAPPARPRIEALRESRLFHAAYQRLGAVAVLRGAGHSRAIVVPYGGNGYHHEADEVMRCVREGRRESATMPLGESVAVMEAVDAARSSWARPAAPRGGDA